MTTNRHQKQRHQDHLRWLRRLATLAENPIYTRLHELDRITKELDLLGTTCTGRVHWRDQDKPGKMPKMYILHSIGQSCPIHGTPLTFGDRLRTYIGVNVTKQNQARAAISREQTRRVLVQRQTDTQNALLRSGYHITQYYKTLGYTVPHQDQPTHYPEPNPNWTHTFTL